ncbi:MarR family transcriptional regulator [Micrococcales bacterium 31B]|nr:MarR family transcriptional regulator [Micrococcales bacterium 31B]
MTGFGSRDAVDEILQAWQRERPDLDVLPLAILSRISRLARRLDLARRDAFAEHGLELWEFDVLAALRRAGAPYELSPGALASETLVTSGTMTNRVDRLVAKALVTRRTDPSDRRAVRVRLADAGATVVDAAFESLLSHENQILAGLDDAERQHLADLLRAMGAALGE